MRWLCVIALVLGCNREPEPSAKERAFNAAVKATDDAKRALQRLEAARADHVKAMQEHAEVKEKLAEVRKQAAATIRQADAKLAELEQQLARATSQAEKAELQATIDRIKQLEAELEASQ